MDYDDGAIRQYQNEHRDEVCEYARVCAPERAVTAFLHPIVRMDTAVIWREDQSMSATPLTQVRLLFVVVRCCSLFVVVVRCRRFGWFGGL